MQEIRNDIAKVYEEMDSDEAISRKMVEEWANHKLDMNVK